MVVPPRPIGYLVADIARLMRRRFERALAAADTGVTAAEARVLAYVEHFPARRQAVLAERLGVEPMTLSALVDRLEASGLLCRRPDPQDRRAKLIELAPGAAPVMGRIHDVAVRLRTEAVAGFSPADVDAVYDLLGRMHENLTDCGPSETS
ncbi:MarR family winged helix-turn-helix transcriptional regulator [Stappia sp. ES.058]|uniref:MarR family winged helix-turn-helix transcriptional regulator n=1 Tax=Stappia sp. ES.058 TaxID=1881061 RepID=UPI00087CCA8C|nr:MarR family winged helix-turn-helix transcriptional regulator [Stappia sp. ES.058]SDU39476.1 DNA-binding transcriptional regulator, MarR family [Stappia sp. ES.058]